MEMPCAPYDRAMLDAHSLSASCLGCDQRSSVGLYMQDYKSLRVAFMICTKLVNTQTHRHIETACDRLAS